MEACLFISIHICIYSFSRYPIRASTGSTVKVANVNFRLKSATSIPNCPCTRECQSEYPLYLCTHNTYAYACGSYCAFKSYQSCSLLLPRSHTYTLTATHSAAHCQMTMNIFNEKHFLPLLSLFLSLSPHAPRWLNTCTYLVNMHTHMYTHTHTGRGTHVCVEVKSKQY